MNSKKLESDKRVVLYGRPSKIEYAIEILKNENLSQYNEKKARLIIQNLIDKKDIRVNILFCGNGVYSFKKILNDVKKLQNKGMEGLTNRLYDFLHLCCGSIAHYDKQGWIACYPTLSHLRDFFKRNEFGKRVLHHIPHWKTDVIKIVKQIEKELKLELELN